MRKNRREKEVENKTKVNIVYVAGIIQTEIFDSGMYRGEKIIYAGVTRCLVLLGKKPWLFKCPGQGFSFASS